MDLEKYFRPLFAAGLLLGLLLSGLYAQHQIVGADQWQMIDKGYLGALNHFWLSYGNVASAMGNVPGSLSAYLVGLPLKVWYSPYSPMLLLIALRLVGYLLFDQVIKQIGGARMRLLFMVICWLNPWFLYESLLYNPSYLFFFAALHCWSAFKMRTHSSAGYTFLHLLAIGMAMQLHYSWPLLCIISAYLFYRRQLRVNLWGVLFAALVIGLSLVPYLQETLANQSITREANPDAQARYIGWGLVHVYPLFKPVIYWLRYASWIFTNKLITGAQFPWLESVAWLQLGVTYLWRTLAYGIGALSMLLVLRANYYLWQQVKPIFWRGTAEQAITPSQWLTLYSVAGLLASLVCAALAPIIFSFWHLMLIFPCALFPLLLFIRHWAKGREPQFARYLLWAACYCLVINLQAANDSRKYSYQVSYPAQVERYVAEQQQSGRWLPHE